MMAVDTPATALMGSLEPIPGFSATKRCDAEAPSTLREMGQIRPRECAATEAGWDSWTWCCFERQWTIWKRFRALPTRAGHVANNLVSVTESEVRFRHDDVLIDAMDGSRLAACEHLHTIARHLRPRSSVDATTALARQENRREPDLVDPARVVAVRIAHKIDGQRHARHGIEQARSRNDLAGEQSVLVDVRELLCAGFKGGAPCQVTPCRRVAPSSSGTRMPSTRPRPFRRRWDST